MSSIDFHFNQFSGPEEYLPAMHTIQDLAVKSNFTTGDKFITVWSKVFATWITDEVISVCYVTSTKNSLFSVN